YWAWAARRDARGNRGGHRPACPRHCRGAARRRDLEDPSRPALAWHGGSAGPNPGRQPTGLARRMSGRIRGAQAGARACLGVARGRGGVVSPADVIQAVEYPRRFASLVKFEHTVFALPFAYVGAFLAVDGVPSAHDVLWVTVAMVGARSLAMGLNRLSDAGIDARNPRTAARELPSGLLKP